MFDGGAGVENIRTGVGEAPIGGGSPPDDGLGRCLGVTLVPSETAGADIVDLTVVLTEDRLAASLSRGGTGN